VVGEVGAKHRQFTGKEIALEYKIKIHGILSGQYFKRISLDILSYFDLVPNVFKL